MRCFLQEHENLPPRGQTDWVSGREQGLLMGLAVLLALLRAPLLLLHGRVFAEEGTVYLQQAWNAPAIMTITAVHQGYYSFLMNTFALLAARVVPLEYAGLLSTWMALFILLLTIYLTVICEAFRTKQIRALAAALVLFAAAG